MGDLLDRLFAIGSPIKWLGVLEVLVCDLSFGIDLRNLGAIGRLVKSLDRLAELLVGLSARNLVAASHRLGRLCGLGVFLVRLAAGHAGIEGSLVAVCVLLECLGRLGGLLVRLSVQIAMRNLVEVGRLVECSGGLGGLLVQLNGRGVAWGLVAGGLRLGLRGHGALLDELVADHGGIVSGGGFLAVSTLIKDFGYLRGDVPRLIEHIMIGDLVNVSRPLEGGWVGGFLARLTMRGFLDGLFAVSVSVEELLRLGNVVPGLLARGILDALVGEARRLDVELGLGDGCFVSPAAVSILRESFGGLERLRVELLARLGDGDFVAEGHGLGRVRNLGGLRLVDGHLTGHVDFVGSHAVCRGGELLVVLCKVGHLEGGKCDWVEWVLVKSCGAIAEDRGR